MLRCTVAAASLATNRWLSMFCGAQNRAGKRCGTAAGGYELHHMIRIGRSIRLPVVAGRKRCQWVCSRPVSPSPKARSGIRDRYLLFSDIPPGIRCRWDANGASEVLETLQQCGNGMTWATAP